MPQRREYEVLPDVTLSPEEEARVEAAIKQADVDVPPKFYPVRIDGSTAVIPIPPARIS